MDGSETPYQVVIVPLDQLASVWPVITPLIEPAVALSSGRYLLEDYYEEIRQEKADLVLIVTGSQVHAALIVKGHEYPRLQALQVLLCGGHDLPGWASVLDDALSRAARATGCSKIEWFGRPGWTRFSEPWGYRPWGTMVERDVE